MTTYYVPKTAMGDDTHAQQRKLGTPAYGFKTIARALAYTPPGGYVEVRYNEECGDWAGGIVAWRPTTANNGE